MLLEWVLAGIAILGKLVAAEVETSNIIYDSRYTILNEAAVGKGLGTVIRIAERLSDAQIFAAKFFDPIDEWYEEMLRREFAFGHFFEHENIARSIEIVEASPTACIIMEYFPTEMLNVLVSGELSIWKVDKMFKQILSGVAHMHSLGVAHRDLKMDNVLLDENGDAKIIDFGRSSFARGMITGEVILAYGKPVHFGPPIS
jgi:serine/threonine protein kinase